MEDQEARSSALVAARPLTRSHWRRRRRPACWSVDAKNCPSTHRRRRCSSPGSTSRSTCPPPAGTRSRRRAGSSSGGATCRGRQRAVEGRRQATSSRCAARGSSATTGRHVRRLGHPTHALLREADERDGLLDAHVEVQFEGLGGLRHAACRSAWCSTAASGSRRCPSPVVANLLPLLPGRRRPCGSGSRRSAAAPGRSTTSTSTPGSAALTRGQAAGTCCVMQWTPPPPERQHLAAGPRPPRGPGRATRAARAPRRRSPRPRVGHDQPAVADVVVRVRHDDRRLLAVGVGQPRQLDDLQAGRRAAGAGSPRQCSKLGFASSVTVWSTTLPGATNAQMLSTWPSVSSSSTSPRPSQTTRSTPSCARSSASISSRASCGLRCSSSRHCSVVISVPSPSTVIEPPSRIEVGARRAAPRPAARARAWRTARRRRRA